MSEDVLECCDAQSWTCGCRVIVVSAALARHSSALCRVDGLFCRPVVQHPCAFFSGYSADCAATAAIHQQPLAAGRVAPMVPVRIVGGAPHWANCHDSFSPSNAFDVAARPLYRRQIHAAAGLLFGPRGGLSVGSVVARRPLAGFDRGHGLRLWRLRAGCLVHSSLRYQSGDVAMGGVFWLACAASTALQRCRVLGADLGFDVFGGGRARIFLLLWPFGRALSRLSQRPRCVAFVHGGSHRVTALWCGVHASALGRRAIFARPRACHSFSQSGMGSAPGTSA